MKLVALMGMLSIGICALAQETVTLQIQPSLCILQSGETECRDRVEVRWSADKRYTLCLYEGENEAPLSCWEDSRSGIHRSLLVAEEDTEFQLIEMAGRQVLASRAFEVVADAQQYRRRRRNPWSFF